MIKVSNRKKWSNGYIPFSLFLTWLFTGGGDVDVKRFHQHRRNEGSTIMQLGEQTAFRCCTGNKLQGPYRTCSQPSSSSTHRLFILRARPQSCTYSVLR